MDCALPESPFRFLVEGMDAHGIDAQHYPIADGRLDVRWNLGDERLAIDEDIDQRV
jgi:hypothetical protein